MRVSRAYEVLAFLSIAISFYGALRAFYYCWMEEYPPLWPSLIVFLTFFFVFNTNRAIFIPEHDFYNVPKRAYFLLSKRRIIMPITLVAFAIALLASLILAKTLIPALLVAIAGVAIVVYSRGIKGVVLENYPIKNFLVAAFVAAIPYGIDLFFSKSLSPLVHVVAAVYFLDFFFNSLFFDVRDIEGDKKTGKRTIPVLIGRKLSLLALAILVGLMVFLLGGTKLEKREVSLWLIPAYDAMCLLIFLVVENVLGRKIPEVLFYDGLVEGQPLITTTLAVLLFS